MSAVAIAARAKERLAEAHTSLADAIAAYDAALYEAHLEMPVVDLAAELGISRQLAHKRILAHRRRSEGRAA